MYYWVHELTKISLTPTRWAPAPSPRRFAISLLVLERPTGSSLSVSGKPIKCNLGRRCSCARPVCMQSPSDADSEPLELPPTLLGAGSVHRILLLIAATTAPKSCRSDLASRWTIDEGCRGHNPRDLAACAYGGGASPHGVQGILALRPKTLKQS